MITCNIVSYNNQNLIANTIKQIDGYFDQVRIVFGMPIKEKKLESFLERQKIQVFFNDWNCSLANQLNFLIKKATPGEWFLYLSDDEVPSLPLLESFNSMIEYCIDNNLDGARIPFVDELNYRMVNNIVEIEQKTYEENLTSQESLFRIRRLLKIKKDSFFWGHVHETSFYYMDKDFYKSQWPIIHRKSTIRTILGVAWCALLDHYHSNVPNEWFGLLLWNCLENKIPLNVHDIERRLKKGDVSETFKDCLMRLFGQDNLHIGAWPVLYYIIYHPDQLPQDFNLLENIIFQYYIRWFVIGRDRLKIEQSEMGNEIKKRLLSLGKTYIEKDGTLS